MKKHTCMISILLILAFSFPLHAQSLPTAVTLPATNIAGSAAQLNGSVNPNGVVTTCYFEYGTTIDYGLQTSNLTTGSFSVEVSVNAMLTNLASGTLYHYRFVATNLVGTSWGDDMTFTAIALPPTAVTLAATIVSETTAQLNGTVNPNGATSTYYFDYGLTDSYGSQTSKMGAGSSTRTMSVSTTLGNLKSGASYHYRLVATNIGGISQGSDVVFTTSVTKPSTVTLATTKITASTAQLNGTVNPNGPSTTYFFEYGPTSVYGLQTSNMAAGSGGVDISVSASINGLSSSVLYHYRLVATNSAGTSQGSDMTFTTSPITNGSGWVQTNAPYTGQVRSFAVSGTNLFAGTDGGVFLTTNNGTSWTAVNTGLTNVSIRALAVSGTNLFAGTLFGGVFLSTNNGTSWAAVNSGLTNTSVYSLAFSAANLFAGTYDGGVFLSRNNGTSWTAVNGSVTILSVWSLAVAGTNVFAGSLGMGVFLSTNNGTSWTAVNTGLTNTNVWSLAVSGTYLFAGTFGGGVFLSTNNGTSWTAVSAGLTAGTSVLSLAVSGTNLFAGTYGGGVFLSTNNGTSWTAVNTGLTNTFVNALAAPGANLFAGTGAGVWRRPLSEMVPPVLPSPTLTGPLDGATIYVGTITGLSWTSVGSGISYEVEFDAGTGQSSLISAGSDLSYPYMPTSESVGTHTWHVRGKNGDGSGTWSSTRSFTVALREYQQTSLTIKNTQLPYVTQGLMTNTGELVAEQGGVKITLDGPVRPVQVGQECTLKIKIEPGDSWKTNEGVELIPREILGLGISQLLVHWNKDRVTVRSPTLVVNGTTVSEEIVQGALGLIFFPSGILLSDIILGDVLKVARQALVHQYFKLLTSPPTYGVSVFTPTSFGGSSETGELKVSIGGTGWADLAFARSVEVDLPFTPLVSGNSQLSIFPDIRAQATRLGGGIPTTEVDVGFEFRRQVVIDFEARVEPQTPLILIPGVMGSPLFWDENENGLLDRNIWVIPHGGLSFGFSEQLWINETVVFMDFVGDALLRLLHLDTEGRSEKPIRVPPIPTDTSFNINKLITFEPLIRYQGFVREMSKTDQTGYKLDDNHPETAGENFFVFTYDWRLSCLTNADTLKAFIDTVKKRTGSKKVDVVVHSLGGIVAKSYIKKYSEAKYDVRRLIFIATPHLGAPIIMRPLTNGVFPDTIKGQYLSQTALQYISENMAPAYQLLPSSDFVKEYGAVVRTDESSYSYSETNEFLKTTIFYPGEHKLNGTMVEEGESFQTYLTEPIDFGGIQVFNIVGTGSPTIGYFTPTTKKESEGTYMSPVFGLDGDDTVPLRSAEHISGDVTVADFYINCSSEKPLKLSHSALPSSAPVIEIVKALLDDTPNKTGPWVNADYISTTAPSNKFASSHIEAFVGSPVTLHAFDELGRHTGPTSDSTWEQKIPGSKYVPANLRDMNSKKILLVPKGGKYRFVIKSQDTVGKFNLSLAQIEEGYARRMLRFDTIAVTRNTIATCNADTISSAIVLSVDRNGDGKQVVTITPTKYVVTGFHSDPARESVPTKFRLADAYPNPFNPSTNIRYDLPKSTFVSVKVLNVLGQEIATLVDEQKAAGSYQLQWNASTVPSGIYFYRLQAGEYVETKKMVLLR